MSIQNGLFGILHTHEELFAPRTSDFRGVLVRHAFAAAKLKLMSDTLRKRRVGGSPVYFSGSSANKQGCCFPDLGRFSAFDPNFLQALWKAKASSRTAWRADEYRRRNQLATTLLSISDSAYNSLRPSRIRACQPRTALQQKHFPNAVRSQVIDVLEAQEI